VAHQQDAEHRHDEQQQQAGACVARRGRTVAQVHVAAAVDGRADPECASTDRRAAGQLAPLSGRRHE